MTLFWRLAPWLTRLLLFVVASLFTLISLRYMLDPVGRAAADEITLGSVTAISRLRVSFSGFPLAFALIMLGCLVSSKRLLTGLVTLLTVLVVVTGVRLLGIVVDGSAAEPLRLLRVEFILLALAGGGLLLELARRRRLTPASAPFISVGGGSNS